MTKDMAEELIKIPVKDFMVEIKKVCSLSRGIIKMEEYDKHFRKVLPPLLKNPEARVRIERTRIRVERDRLLFKMAKKEARPILLVNLALIKKFGLKVKKEDVDVMKKALALCEEGKKVSRAKSRRSPVKKQFTRE